jgi:hypothetical protein
VSYSHAEPTVTSLPRVANYRSGMRKMTSDSMRSRSSCELQGEEDNLTRIAIAFGARSRT